MTSEERPSIIPDKFLPMTDAMRDDLLKDMQNRINGMRRVIAGFQMQLEEMEKVVKALKTSEGPNDHS
jgi:hypothetical protein